MNQEEKNQQYTNLCAELGNSFIEVKMAEEKFKQCLIKAQNKLSEPVTEEAKCEEK
jgi:hypothetical protein